MTEGATISNMDYQYLAIWAAPQFYIQLVFKAPLCITLTISDQKIVSGSLFKIHNYFFKNFSKKNLTLFYATF